MIIFLDGFVLIATYWFAFFVCLTQFNSLLGTSSYIGCGARLRGTKTHKKYHFTSSDHWSYLSTCHLYVNQVLYCQQAKRGFAAAAVLFYLWVRLGFWQKKNLTLPGLRIYEKK